MPKNRRDGTTDEQIIAAYEMMKSVPKVMEQFAIGQATVSRVLAKHGIERVGLHEYRKTMKDKYKDGYVGVYTGSTEEILQWYRDGMSMRDIAQKIGRSVRVVSNRVKQAGISRVWQGKAQDHSNWNGGRNKTVQGYWNVLISEDDPMSSMRNNVGRVLEHRLVMARKIGRPLRKSESVHHIDGDRENNSPENLQLRNGKHGSHVVLVCLHCGSSNIGHKPIADVGD